MVVLMLAVTPGRASAQVSFVGVAVTPAFGSPVVVGQQDQAGTIQFVNNSVGGAGTQAITVSSIQINASCGTAAVQTGGASPCSTSEPRPDPASPVLRLDLNGTAATTCPGGPFLLSGPDAEGDFTVTMSGPLTLTPPGQPGSSCQIGFTFDVVQRPTDGVTAAVVRSTASTANFPNTSQTGSSLVTVNRPSPTISGMATPAEAQAGAEVRDVATLTGGNSPTGTVTFRLYDTLNCGTALFTSTKPYVPGTAVVSDPFVLELVSSYHWVATYNGDANHDPVSTPCAAAAQSLVILGEANYFPLSPVRIEDTRFGSGGLSGPVGAGATVEVQVGGRAGVPEGASAVVLNVTVTQPTAEGYLTLYPAGTPRPLAANLNFTPGKTVPNLVVVKLGVGGRVALFNSAGSTHVVFDVAGYYAGAGGNAGRYQPLVPARIADTRTGIGGMRLGPGQSFDLQVAGQGGAPATGVRAAVLNVAVTSTTATSFLTIYPTGEPQPLAANLNFTAGDTVSNRTMTKLGTSGRVTIFNNAGSTDVVVDVGGTYTDASVVGVRGTYIPEQPARILDTRDGTGGGPVGPIPSLGAVEVQIAGRGGLPDSGVKAVILNVAVTQPADAGYLTIFPNGATQPLAADLNYAGGETRPNLVVVQVGANGKVILYASRQTHVVFDVAGWFN